MKLNADKCDVLMFPNHTLMGHNLEIKELHMYLGIAFNNYMSWSPKFTKKSYLMDLI